MPMPQPSTVTSFNVGAPPGVDPMQTLLARVKTVHADLATAATKLAADVATAQADAGTTIIPAIKSGDPKACGPALLLAETDLKNLTGDADAAAQGLGRITASGALFDQVEAALLLLQQVQSQLVACQADLTKAKAANTQLTTQAAAAQQQGISNGAAAGIAVGGLLLGSVGGWFLHGAMKKPRKGASE
jgi:hypothetical protein